MTKGARQFDIKHKPTMMRVRLSGKPKILDGPTRKRKIPTRKALDIKVTLLEIQDGMKGVSNVPKM